MAKNRKPEEVRWWSSCLWFLIPALLYGFALYQFAPVHHWFGDLLTIVFGVGTTWNVHMVANWSVRDVVTLANLDYADTGDKTAAVRQVHGKIKELVVAFVLIAVSSIIMGYFFTLKEIASGKFLMSYLVFGLACTWVCLAVMTVLQLTSAWRKANHELAVA